MVTRPTSGRRRAGGAAGGSEGGYTLVALAVAVTVLSILLAAALPMWETVAQREKEEELIFRGWQYAEAIRVFQQRHGRLPTRLEELVEVKPRSIRKLWEDPTTESGEWGLVFRGAGGQPGQPGGQGGGQELAPGGAPSSAFDRQDRGPGSGRDGGRGRGGLRTPRAGEQRTVGPIVGVRSLSEEESIKVLFGEESYDKWLFTTDRLGGVGAISGIGPEGVQRGGGIQRTDQQGRPVIPKVRWIGRPFRQGLVPPGDPAVAGAGQGRPVDGTGPDGRPVGARPQQPPPRGGGDLGRSDQ